MAEPQPRRLEDFAPLTTAEQKVLDELDTGEVIEIGTDVPETDAGEERLIRARFLRWVILGCQGSEEYRVHEKGLQLWGALITGEGEYRDTFAELDLQGAELARALLLGSCRLTRVPIFDDANVLILELYHSWLPGFSGECLSARGRVSLRNSVCEGQINVANATVDGSFDCGHIKVKGQGPLALLADGMTVRQEFSLGGAMIAGEVSCLGVTVNGDFELQEAQLNNLGGAALTLQKANIMGFLFLITEEDGPLQFQGCLDLTASRVDTLCDDPSTWPDPEAGSFRLNGFEYRFLDENRHVSVQERKSWLALQKPEEFGQSFWPQPYEQCAKVLREMGHQDDARTILIEKERRLREARRAKLSGPKLWWRGFWDRFLALTVCYGQKPLNAGYWLAGFWLLGTLAFAYIHAQDQFKPNNAFVLRADEWAHCSAEHAPPFAYLGDAGQSQLGCFHAQSEAKGLPAFNPFVYSLDVLFPLVQLEQQVHWIPDDDQTWGAAGKALVYVQIVMGWLLSLLAVAGLSGIIKSD